MPPLGEPGVEATAAYVRVQSVVAGMATPTLTPVQATGPLSRLVLLAPVVPIETTTLFGVGDAAFEPDGSVSVSVSTSPRVIGSGPLFVTATVQRMRPPALTEATSAVLLTVRS